MATSDTPSPSSSQTSTVDPSDGVPVCEPLALYVVNTLSVSDASQCNVRFVVGSAIVHGVTASENLGSLTPPSRCCVAGSWLSSHAAAAAAPGTFNPTARCRATLSQQK